MSRKDKMYKMRSLDIDALVGRTILEASINSTKDFVYLKTDKGSLYLTWVGDCCANCYIEHIDGADRLVGSVIASAENTEWIVAKIGEMGDTMESMGTKFKTNKGYVTVETRVEHNGYYGGMILISEEEPMDQYHCPMYLDMDHLEEHLSKMKPLHDF